MTFSEPIQIVPEFHLISYTMGIGVLSLEKSGAKIKNECSCTYTPPTCLHGVDRDKFYLFLFV